MEDIFAGLEIRIKSQPAIFCEHRILIVSLKPVSKLDSLGRDETWRGIIKFEIASPGLDHRRFVPGQIEAVGANPIDVDRHGHLVGGNVRRINHHHALGTRKPNPAVRCPAARILLRAPVRRSDVRRAVVINARHMIGFPIGKVVQALPADLEQPPAGVHPEKSVIIKNHRLNPIVQQPVVAADVPDLIVFQPDKAGLQPRPDHAITRLRKDS